MVATVAVLSDIHGVLPVLDAVLAEPDVAAAERIVVTGDHAAGPMPVEVLDRLVGLGDRCVLVRGNADRELVEVARGRDSAIDVSNWAGRQRGPTRSSSSTASRTRSGSTWPGSAPPCSATARRATTTRSCSSTPG